MVRVGLVDDDREHTELLRAYLARYGQEADVQFQAEAFSDGLSFVEDYDGSLDIVFLDIEMPHMDGMTAARIIRERDASLAIVFITNMAQYAVHGYEVDAVDFMVKPVGYFNFARKLERAMGFLHRRAWRAILLADEDGVVRLSASDVWYVEKDRDHLVYHTEQGVFRKRGTMKAEREMFQGLPFEECTSGCLVNLDRVQRIGREHVDLNGVRLPLSRRMKREFTRSYIDYVGGGL